MRGYSVKIHFLGAACNVTGSMHLLEVNGSRILLECGLFQGRRQEAFERNRHLPLDAKSLDAVVLSHAHIDHSGNLPSLVKAGYRGPIYATHATRSLCSVMLRDSAHIMEADAQYLNKKRTRQNLPPIEPIYTAADAIQSLNHFMGLNYDQPLTIASGVTLTFFDAGHILGSALCALDISEGARTYRLLFTGDLGRYNAPILRDPQPVAEVDYLIIESTYGARRHSTLPEADAALQRIIGETARRGGKVIIPAFSVGRTQELVYALHHQRLAGTLPNIPIYVDSPLAINATEVFRLHPECYDAETHAFMLQQRDPFGFGTLHYLRDAEESKALNARRDPMIIISASGMCESGRILHHLKNNIEQERNTVLFVGFQAPHTLGRRIMEGQEEVSIFGETYHVRAHIESVLGYSAHADREELLTYTKGLGAARLRRAFLVHGEEEAAQALQQAFTHIGVRESVIPHLGDTAEI
jgi:metallo-beta-lactamase family protein